MILKLSGERRGDHVHARIFMGEQRESLALCGTVTFRIGEWQLFGAALLLGGKGTANHLEVILDDPLTREEEEGVGRVAAKRLLEVSNG